MPKAVDSLQLVPLGTVQIEHFQIEVNILLIIPSTDDQKQIFETNCGVLISLGGRLVDGAVRGLLLINLSLYPVPFPIMVTP